MDDPGEYGLVVQALRCGLSNCVLWKSDRTQLRIRENPELLGMTPTAIKKALIRSVESGNFELKQARERRENHSEEFDFVYHAIFPVDGFKYGLYVEIVLLDSDPEVPVISLVNAHPQRP